jgi:Mn2+/Fe2+ NRAMP family transporter
MEFGILGPLVVRDGPAVVGVPGAKERALLADLLVHAGRVVSADRLVEDLWGEARPGRPANTLQGRVSALRRALGPAGSRLRAGPILAGAAVPSLNGSSLPVAVGILGAVVMPHNLFLHSGLIRSRCGGQPPRRVLRRSTIETAVALNLALGVNAAILIMAAATFGRHGVVVDSLGQAHETLRPMLGPLAATGFAVALLASGLASSTTGSLAGQLVLDGLLGWRVPAVARRAVTMVPAVVVLALGVNEVAALVWSQIALSLALPAVAIPLVVLTSRHSVMGRLANRALLRRLATAAVALLVALNLVLLASLVA